MLDIDWLNGCDHVLNATKSNASSNLVALISILFEISTGKFPSSISVEEGVIYQICTGHHFFSWGDLG